MWMNRNPKICGWLCISPFALRCIAIGMIALGILLILLFVPVRYWLALLGLILIAVGAAVYWFF